MKFSLKAVPAEDALRWNNVVEELPLEKRVEYAVNFLKEKNLVRRRTWDRRGVFSAEVNAARCQAQLNAELEHCVGYLGSDLAPLAQHRVTQDATLNLVRMAVKPTAKRLPPLRQTQSQRLEALLHSLYEVRAQQEMKELRQRAVAARQLAALQKKPQKERKASLAGKAKTG